jgi:hypothetical protein
MNCTIRIKERSNTTQKMERVEDYQNTGKKVLNINNKIGSTVYSVSVTKMRVLIEKVLNPRTYSWEEASK